MTVYIHIVVVNNYQRLHIKRWTELNNETKWPVITLNCRMCIESRMNPAKLSLLKQSNNLF